MFGKGIVSGIYKELLQINKKTFQLFFKWTKDLSRCINIKEVGIMMPTKHCLKEGEEGKKGGWEYMEGGEVFRGTLCGCMEL
jgi:hypothetical protein